MYFYLYWNSIRSEKESRSKQKAEGQLSASPRYHNDNIMVMSRHLRSRSEQKARPKAGLFASIRKKGVQIMYFGKLTKLHIACLENIMVQYHTTNNTE